MSADIQLSNDAARRVAALADDLEPYCRRYDDARDSRAIFAYAYYNLTNELANRLAAPDADFTDPNWVADLGVAFGTRYMAAMDAIDDWQRAHATDTATVDSLYQTVPRPWADVYWAICREPSTVLEDLVFAMGAHITYDLPYALLEVGTDIDHLRDYHRMNDVLASGTDAIQDAVTNRYHQYLSQFDHMAGDADEVFTDYWIRIGRSMAWYNALRLQSPLSQVEAQGSIERTTFYLIESVRTAGPWPVRWKTKLVRRLFQFTRRWPNSPPD